MTIDLAVLVPLEKVDIPALQLEEKIPIEGTETIMASFPSDLKTPLDFSENINKDEIGGKENVLKIQQFANSIIPWIMVKHGIVGGVFHIVTPNMSTELLGESVIFPLKVTEYWVDNTYAPGASGDPVVNMDGKLLGIITERGLTYETDFTNTITFPVPSGAVRVLSHKLISWSLDEIKKQWKLHQ